MRRKAAKSPWPLLLGSQVLLLVLGGCATKTATLAWRIVPVQSVAHGAGSAEGYYAIGRQIENSRDWARATDAYRQALRADPGHVDAYNALAVALVRLGQLDDAEAQLRQALACAPQRADLHSNLGYLLLLARRPQEAQRALQQALALDPHNRVAQANFQLAQGRTAAPAPPDQALARAATPAATAAAKSMPAVAVPAAAAPRQDNTGAAALQVSDRATLAPLGVVSGASAGTAATPGFVPAPALPARVAAALPAAMPEGAPAPGAAASPAVPDAHAQAFTLELSNGVGRHGMAAQLRSQLQRRGFEVQRTSNQPPYRQARTVVLYQPGQEAAARRVAQALPLPLPVPLRPDAGQRSGVRVLIGHDWPGTAVRVAGAAAGRRE